MPLFQYKGRNQRGEAVRGELEAASPEAVATQLFNTGVTPIDIALTRASRDVLGALRGRFLRERVTLVDLALFSRQMFTLLKAGVPILQALRGLRDTTANPAFAKVIDGINESLDTGLDLATALRRHPQVFSPLYVSMVQVGETTGSLAEAFSQLATYLEREKDTIDRVKSAARYPTFVVVAMVIAMFVINLFVIPTFAKVYAGFRIELPWATKILMATSSFTVAYWPVLLVVAAASALAVRAYLRTPEGHYNWHKWKLRLPVIGPIFYQATLERFARALAVMIRTGVPLVQGMSVVARAVDNEFIGERILQMRDGVERGEAISHTAAATGLFPALVTQMIAVGENTGAIDELMLNVAEYYEREVDYSLKNLSSAIQPLLIVMLSGLVFLLALGVFLPMWDLVQVTRGG